ncbi:Ribulokinase [compost metagenome]
MVMQMLADVLDLPIHTHRSEQSCACGAAMFAATVAGIFPKVEDAMTAMGAGRSKTYYPNKAFVELYQRRYRKFNDLAGYFIKPYLEAGSFG